MKSTICVAAFVIAVVWGFYFYNFGNLWQLSESREVWGQFGDYVGGVINPLLSFITIILLIRSLNEQQTANVNLAKQAEKQQKLEDFKKLENRFYILIDLQQKGLDDFFVEYKIDDIQNKQKAEGRFAAQFFLEKVTILAMSGKSHDEIRSAMENWDSHDLRISLVRRFYLLIKLIDDRADDDDKKELYETLINFTDMKLLHLICVMVSYYDWHYTQYILNSGILNRKGLTEFITLYSGKKFPE